MSCAQCKFLRGLLGDACRHLFRGVRSVDLSTASIRPSIRPAGRMPQYPAHRTPMCPPPRAHARSTKTPNSILSGRRNGATNREPVSRFLSWGLQKHIVEAWGQTVCGGGGGGDGGRPDYRRWGEGGMGGGLITDGGGRGDGAKPDGRRWGWGRNRSGVDPPLLLQPRLPHGLHRSLSSSRVHSATGLACVPNSSKSKWGWGGGAGGGLITDGGGWGGWGEA